MRCEHREIATATAIETAESTRGWVRMAARVQGLYLKTPTVLTLHPTPCTLYLMAYTLNPIPCTWYPGIPDPSIYTPHPTSYTLHPTPYTLLCRVYHRRCRASYVGSFRMTAFVRPKPAPRTPEPPHLRTPEPKPPTPLQAQHPSIFRSTTRFCRTNLQRWTRANSGPMSVNRIATANAVMNAANGHNRETPTRNPNP